MHRTHVVLTAGAFVFAASCGVGGASSATSVESGSDTAPLVVDDVGAAGEGDDGVSDDREPGVAATAGSDDEPGVEVTADIAYYDSTDGDTLHLDVHRPLDGESLPLVVLFHANPVFGNTKTSETELASMIAGRGAVVVTPTYGGQVSRSDMELLAEQAITWFRDQGPCAVWAALDLAESFGADPEKLVLVGHTTGVFPAQMSLFSPPPAVNGCAAPHTGLAIDKAILFETDWLMVPDIWDQVIIDNPNFMSTVTFWDDLANPSPTSIYVLAGERSAPNTVRSLDGNSYLDSDWIRLRDPDGQLANAFAAAGTLHDDNMSFTDVAQVSTTTLIDAGWNATFLTVPTASHSLDTREAKMFVADLVFTDHSD